MLSLPGLAGMSQSEAINVLRRIRNRLAGVVSMKIYLAETNQSNTISASTSGGGYEFLIFWGDEIRRASDAMYALNAPKNSFMRTYGSGAYGHLSKAVEKANKYNSTTITAIVGYPNTAMQVRDEIDVALGKPPPIIKTDTTRPWLKPVLIGGGILAAGAIAAAVILRR